MSEPEWVVVDEVAGSFQADIIQGLLEAQEIPVVVSKSGAGTAIGITVGALGRVLILVPEPDFERAQQVIQEYYDGAFQDQLMDLEDEIDQSSQEFDED